MKPSNGCSTAECTAVGEKNFRVEGLHCTGCTQKIITALREKYIGSDWQFSLATGVLEGSDLSDDVLRKDVQYIVDLYESDVFVLPMNQNEALPEEGTVRNLALEKLVKRTTRIGVGAVVLSVGLTLEALKLASSRGMDLGVSFVLLATYLYVGLPVLKRAIRNSLKGELFDENFLMAIATVGAIVLGELPEALGVMLFYELGEHFQGKAVDQSRRAIEKLLSIRPDQAHLVVGDKIWDVPSEQLAVEDELLVRPGERIPTDAVLISELAYVDTSSMTGESKPVRLTKGELVLGGYINQQQTIYCRVEKPFQESTASRLIQLVQQAADKKAKPEQFMTKFARWYTPAVLLLSLLTALIPPILLGESFSEWSYRALIFLVISCPCALVISIPLSYFGAIGAASKMGVLVKGGNYLEALADLKSIYFDKTGTLTEGRFQVNQVITTPLTSRDEVMKWATLAEQNSNHPIAIAIRKAAEPLNLQVDMAFEMTETAGEGISINKPGCIVFVGKGPFVERSLNSEHIASYVEVADQIINTEGAATSTIVHVSKNGAYYGALILNDRLKASSAETVAKLYDLNIEVAILSGDRSETVGALASQLNIDQFFGDLKPKDKLVVVEKALERNSKLGKGGKIAFVGDGINDAPVIARADVGVAMGGIGSEAAIEAADIVLMRDEPIALINAIALAKRTRGIVYQNIFMALSVKIAFMGLGLVGISGMWEAIFADVGVALLAVFNAMRLIPSEKS